MKVTKKLRDVTPDEYSDWYKCRTCIVRMCSNCPFKDVECAPHSHRCWVSHKDLFIDKFLDQTIEVEAPDVLEEKKHKYHVYYVMKGDMYVFANNEEEAEEIVNHKKFDDLVEHLDSGCDIANTLQVEEGEENEY